MRQYQIQDYETDGATCPVCGEQYSGRPGLSKHHAAQHGEKFKPLAACDWCGILYTETVSNLHAAKRHYCSGDCRSEAKSHHQTGERSPVYKRIVKECNQCESKFEVRPSRDHRKFCSPGCVTDWNNETRSLCEKEMVEMECGQCGQTFEVYPSRTERRFCSQDCSGDWKSERIGADNPLWTGGTDWYRRIRSALGPTGWSTQRRRHLDGECKLCGETDDRLALHHIIPVLSGGLNGAWNYMTLCTGCHTKVENYTKDIVTRPLSPTEIA